MAEQGSLKRTWFVGLVLLTAGAAMETFWDVFPLGVGVMLLGVGVHVAVLVMGVHQWRTWLGKAATVTAGLLLIWVAIVPILYARSAPTPRRNGATVAGPGTGPTGEANVPAAGANDGGPCQTVLIHGKAFRDDYAAAWGWAHFYHQAWAIPDDAGLSLHSYDWVKAYRVLWFRSVQTQADLKIAVRCDADGRFFCHPSGTLSRGVAPSFAAVDYHVDDRAGRLTIGAQAIGKTRTVSLGSFTWRPAPAAAQ